MRRIIRKQRHSTVAHMRYVLCLNCGDAVAGRLPRNDSLQLRCTHCRHVFPFDESKVMQGHVTCDASSGRWKAVSGEREHDN
jgi:DNA-directed RNA polymerase subunit RPC12/RpoP